MKHLIKLSSWYQAIKNRKSGNKHNIRKNNEFLQKEKFRKSIEVARGIDPFLHIWMS